MATFLRTMFILETAFLYYNDLSPLKSDKAISATEMNESSIYNIVIVPVQLLWKHEDTSSRELGIEQQPMTGLVQQPTSDLVQLPVAGLTQQPEAGLAQQPATGLVQQDKTRRAR